ncbi:MAG: PilZ domain-containing protein, partial [Myxococcaceae bacterium]|nr:PilZ domain-containing protein [Myxococcaceae bacterium]
MEDRYENRRRFVRHPIRVPVSVRPHGGSEPFLSRAGDLSEGGLSFASVAPFERGAMVDIELPVHHSRFTLKGAVASCTAHEDGSWRIGLSFTETGLNFKMKLAEQVLR